MRHTEQSSLLPSDARLSAEANQQTPPPQSRGKAAAGFHAARATTRHFLTSKAGHYAVLALVSLDVACIFADFLISLYVCEQSCGGRSSGNMGMVEALEKTQQVLGVVSLVFSCGFMTELLASIWAFGFPFFKSKFHIFDAFIIIASFVLEVCLKGVLEEVGAVVVILRLFRVVKIIDEFSAGAEEQMDAVGERVEALQRENKGLQKEKDGLREERDSLRRERDGLSGQRDDLRSERDGMSKDMDNLRQETDGLRKQVEGIKDEMAGLRKERDALDWELKTMRRFQGLGPGGAKESKAT